MRTNLWLCCVLLSASCSERGPIASSGPRQEPSPAGPATRSRPTRDAGPSKTGFRVTVKETPAKPTRTIDPDILAGKPNALFGDRGDGPLGEGGFDWTYGHYIREHNASIEVVMSAQCSKQDAPRVRAADDGSIALEASASPSCSGDADQRDYWVRIEGLPSGEYTVRAAGLAARQVSIDASSYDRAVNEVAHRALGRLSSPHTSKLPIQGTEATVHVYRADLRRMRERARATPARSL